MPSSAGSANSIDRCRYEIEQLRDQIRIKKQENEEQQKLREVKERKKWVRSRCERKIQEGLQRDRSEWKRKREEDGQQEYRRRELYMVEWLDWERLWQGRLPPERWEQERWWLDSEKQEFEKQECERRKRWEQDREREQQRREQQEYWEWRQEWWKWYDWLPVRFLRMLPEIMLEEDWNQESEMMRHTWREQEALLLAPLEQQLASLEQLAALELERQQRPQKLSSAFSEIERLSTWVPSVANKRKLGVVLKSAKEQLDKLRPDEDYHDYLREFMANHHALCVFIIHHAEDIDDQNSERIAELFKELRQMAQKLRSTALKKAKGYERFYDDFIANRDELSDLLDSASKGQGRSLVDDFTSGLQGMANSMRQEADHWERQGNEISDWQNTRELYLSACNTIPDFPPIPDDPLPDDPPFISTGQPITSPPTPNEPNPHALVQTAQCVSTSFASLHTYILHTQSKVIQNCFAKTGQSVTNGLNETKAHLKSAADIAGEALLRRPRKVLSEMILRLVKTTSRVSKMWKKIYYSVKFAAPVLGLFFKPLRAMLPAHTQQSYLECDHYDLMIASIDVASRKQHPCLIDYQASLRGMPGFFLSLANFWADTDKSLVRLMHESRPCSLSCAS